MNLEFYALVSRSGHKRHTFFSFIWSSLKYLSTLPCLDEVLVRLMVDIKHYHQCLIIDLKI